MKKIFPMQFHQAQFDLCGSTSSVLYNHTEVQASAEVLQKSWS